MSDTQTSIEPHLQSVQIETGVETGDSDPALSDAPPVPWRVTELDPRRWARELGRRAALEEVDRFPRNEEAANGPIDVLDVFCGCGGLSCGFEVVGRMVPSYRLAGAADIDPWAITTYERNLPIRPGSVDLAQATTTATALDEFVGTLNLRAGAPLVLVGGPPCQGFSAHRKKDGKPNDARNDLVRAYARLALHLQPEIVVLENVPEVLAAKHWYQIEYFMNSLAEAGYHLRAQIHNLAAYGAPQERFRALVIASRRPFEMPEAFLDPEAFRTVRDAIGWLPAIEPGQPSPADEMHLCTNHRQSTIDTIRRVPIDGGRRPSGVGPACLQRVDGFRDVYGRLYWDRPANTITAYARNPASGRYVHPEQHRGLSVREAALLQGFPRRWHFEGPFDHRYQQIGNAVPPVFAAYLAAHLLGELWSTDPAGVDLGRLEQPPRPTSDSFSSGIAGRKRGRRRVCTLDLL